MLEPLRRLDRGVGRQLLDLFTLLRLLFGASPRLTLLWAGLTLIAGLAPAAHLWLGKRIVDRLPLVAGEGAHAVGAVLPYVWLWLATGAVLAVCHRLCRLVEDHLRERATIHIKSLVLDAAARVPMIRMEEPEFFNLLQRASSAADGQTVYLLRGMVAIAQSVVSIAGILVILIARAWELAALLLAASLPLAWYKARAGFERWKLHRRQTQGRRRMEYLGGLLTDVRANKELRLFRLPRHLLTLWDEARRANLQEQWALESRFGRRLLLFELGNAGAYLFALAGAAILLPGRGLTLGDYVMMTEAVVRLQTLLHTFLDNAIYLHDDAIRLGDLFEYLEQVEAEFKEEREEAGEALRRTGEIQLRDVTFTYPGADRPAVRELNATIRRGERIALVGLNGSGKTTLVKLILGLYRPTLGEVVYTFEKPGEHGEPAAGGGATAVFQDFTRYEFTARENIGLGDLRRIENHEAIAAAARKGGGAEVVESLPAGFETKLGKSFGGTDLSGGEWQKLAASRAFMREEAAILVLDEPTAELDPLAEAAVFRRFAEVTAGKTTLLVSHRLASTKLADRILYLEDGRIVEEGSHDELIQRRGAYAKLYETQAQWYR